MKCNVGGFTIENIEDAHKFLKLMQEEDFNYYFNNFKLTNPKLEKAEDGSYYITMDDFYGDIEDDLEKIAAKMLEKLAARLRKNGCEVEFPENLAADIASRSDAKRFGARRIRRTIRHEVEEPLSGLILSGRLSPGKHYIFDGKLAEK